LKRSAFRAKGLGDVTEKANPRGGGSEYFGHKVRSVAGGRPATGGDRITEGGVFKEGFVQKKGSGRGTRHQGGERVGEVGQFGILSNRKRGLFPPEKKFCGGVCPRGGGK